MKKHTRKILILGILLAAVVCLASCGSANTETPLPSEPDKPAGEPAGETNTLPSEEPQTEENTAPVSDEALQAAIQVEWSNSPHASAFVLDEANQNNSCARCHSPINWQPSIDDLPESCYACKFELEDPDPLIAEGDWQNIPCMVCHEVGKKDKVDPEYKWLEIAQLEEYAAVGSSTELCQKCHQTEAFAGHGGVQDLGIHQDMACIDCHDAHNTQASCMDAGCHESVMDTGIPGHTDDHLNVSCVACHDAAGMELGFREEDGVFTTKEVVVTEEGENVFFFASHNLKLESTCQDCHFAGNPWNITPDVEQ